MQFALYTAFLTEGAQQVIYAHDKKQLKVEYTSI